jgi:CBS domain-containing protein
MRPVTPDLRIRGSTTLGQALGQMARADTGRLLVMDDERLTGLVTRSGIARVVHLQMDIDGGGIGLRLLARGEGGVDLTGKPEGVALHKEATMKIEQLMTRTVRACRHDDPLTAAARIMWEADCGCVPVLAAGNGAERVVGMITDRDICMAAYTQGRPLSQIPVSSAMADGVFSCRTSDSLATALRVMETNQVRRLPVLDAADHLIGMIAFADLAREAKREHTRGKCEISDAQIAEAVERISEPRTSRALTVAA